MRYTCTYSVVIFLELTALVRDACLESASFRERCPRPHLKNGWVKLRSRGRIAKFNCIREFQLLGEKFATCLGGEWDHPAPLCVKPGCEALSLSNGQMMATYRGAVVTFFCNPGYTLQGIAKLYCDGKSWNGTAPQCTAISSEPALSCDFESEDLCGWTQDPHHHFNWTRLNHNTPSGSVGTGPSYDHTFGKGKDGYYLYIETSGPRKQNDTARLYSPVYSPDVVASQPSCFIFWYHMFGATVGSLAVYIKPDNMELTSELEAGFFQSGNKGDVWLDGIVSIPTTGVPFQIIIEGVRGPGYVGDIAIDDVRLANGSDCEQPTTDMLIGTTYVTHEVSSEVADDRESCRLRCMRRSMLPTLSTSEEMSSPTCDCHSSCRFSKTCCKDYSVYCTPIYTETTADANTVAVAVRSTRPYRTYPTPPPLPPLEPHPLENFTLGFLFTTTKMPVIQTMTTREDIFRPIPIPPDPTPLILNLPHLPTLKSTRVTPNETTVTSTTTSVSAPREATTKMTSTRLPAVTLATTLVRNATIAAAAPTTTKTSTTIPTTKTTATTTPTRATATKLLATTIKRTTTTTTTTRRKPRPSFRTTAIIPWATITSKPRLTTVPASTAVRFTIPPPSLPNTVRSIPDSRSTSKPRVTAETSTRKPYTKASITIRTKSSSWKNILAPSTMRSILENDVHGKEWQAAPKEPLMQSEEPVPISLIAGIAVLVATVAIVFIAVSIFIRRRRKSRSQQNLAEDSDVRFLTADEILDFTLAQPRGDEEL